MLIFTFLSTLLKYMIVAALCISVYARDMTGSCLARTQWCLFPIFVFGHVFFSQCTTSKFDVQPFIRTTRIHPTISMHGIELFKRTRIEWNSIFHFLNLAEEHWEKTTVFIRTDSWDPMELQQKISDPVRNSGTLKKS